MLLLLEVARGGTYPIVCPINGHIPTMGSRGAGSLRQRDTGRWEVRVSVGVDPVSGRSISRSVTVVGDLADARRRQEELAAQAAALRLSQQQPLRTVGELLERWMSAEHGWKPSTWSGYRLAVRRLTADPLAARAPASVSPPVLRAAMRAWSERGIPTTTISLHVRTLRSAFGWAFHERLLASQPLAGFRGPPQPEPRRDVPLDVVRELLAAADHDVQAATRADRWRHQTEQVRLLLRLASDTGARRGELAALRTTDLHGRLLHIERGVSNEIVTTTKTGRSRRITLGTTTAQLWHEQVATWQQQVGDQRLGPWLFSADRDHRTRLRASTLSHWFRDFVRQHGHAGVCLHALRHTVATTLVADGHLLQAQQRLGHAEASTTLRQYCHALPLNDQGIADHLDQLLVTDA